MKEIRHMLQGAVFIAFLIITSQRNFELKRFLSPISQRTQRDKY